MEYKMMEIALESLVTVLVVTVPLVGWRMWLRRPQAQANVAPRLNAELEARLERIETVVEAMSVEMERVTEGQRFTTKLLTERAAADSGQPAFLAAPRG